MYYTVDKPKYMLFDEELELYDDVDTDPYAEDVTDELDFDKTFQREYEPELSVIEEVPDDEEQEVEMRAAQRVVDRGVDLDDHPIDNMRW